MDKKLIEDVARAIQRQHDKEMLGQILKWEKRPAKERSSWRLVARAALKVISPGEPDATAGAPDVDVSRALAPDPSSKRKPRKRRTLIS